MSYSNYQQNHLENVYADFSAKLEEGDFTGANLIAVNLIKEGYEHEGLKMSQEVLDAKKQAYEGN